MARGRKAQPAAVKEAKGNPGRRRIARTADDAARELAGAPPAWLDMSDVGTPLAADMSKIAREVWTSLHADLVRLKLLRSTDENAFGRYCQYMAEWIHFTRVLLTEGYTYRRMLGTGEEALLPHPATKARHTANQALIALGDAMGLTPAARQRIQQQMAQVLPAAQPGLDLEGKSGAAKGEARGKPLAGGSGPFRAGFLLH